MRYLILIVLCMITMACNPTIKSPITVEAKYYDATQDGQLTCSLKIKVAQLGWGVLYTDYSPDNCKYSAGDVIK
jgi:hypothetical protein